MSRFLRITAVVYLCSVAVFPLLRFIAPELTGGSLNVYLLVFFLHAAFMVWLGWLVNRDAINISHSVFLAGACLFLSGVVYSGAFGMGAPPRTATAYMAHGAQELWRGGLLILAAILALAGLLIFMYADKQRKGLLLHNALRLLTVGAAVLTLYDFFWGTFQIPRDIQAWTSSGQDPNDFFKVYDMKNDIRGAGRCLIYLSTLLVLFSGWRKGLVSTVVAIILGLLTVFLLQDVLVPLINASGDINAHIGMVPAVALAPLYFVGIYWVYSYKGS